jgi:hypothetical protein
MTAYNIVGAASMVAGQPEDISQVLANFQAIQAVLNGNLDNANINAGAAIAIAKLAGYPADASKVLKGDGSWAVAGGGGMANPMTAIGDVIVGGTAGTPSRLILGGAGTVLTSVGGTPAWQAPAAPPAGITSVTALPGSPTDGQTVLMRAGASPYEFELLTYNATYGKWVGVAHSSQMWNATQGSGGNSNALGLPRNMIVVPYGALHSAGLNLQMRLVGSLNSDDGTGYIQAQFASISSVGANGAPGGGYGQVGPTMNGGTYPNSALVDSGWQVVGMATTTFAGLTVYTHGPSSGNTNIDWVLVMYRWSS